MSASESARTSSPQALGNNQQIPALATLGEYTVYPMQHCTEEQVATLFSKICQRGNPVLQGRPAGDLVLLGRAMYRRANVLNLGQVIMHGDQPIAMGVSWDMAEGGVWNNSGLEMPASLAAHAACGKAVFDSVTQRVSSFLMGRELGFEDGMQFTLLPTLNKRSGGVFAKFGPDDMNKQWDFSFDKVAEGVDKVVADELREVGGQISISLTSLEWAVNGEKDEWMARAAATVKLQADETRRPSTQMATNQLNWARQTQSSNMITSRL